MLKTISSTEYYSVRGTTTGAIFDDIERNGLFDNKARRAIGVTSGELSVDWRGIETRPYNSLVDQHNGAASRRNGLADEHNRVVAVNNGLIEALNWTQ